MHYDLYNRIVSKIRELNSRHCLKDLYASFPDVKLATLKSILSLEYSKKVKRFFSQYIAPASVQRHYNFYINAKQQDNEAGFILRYADNLDIPPSIVARMILEEYIKEKGDDTINCKTEATRLMRDTSQIQDGTLSVEVFLCILDDRYQGPIADAAKLSIGIEYELKLKRKLDHLGCCFVDETVLRNQGYDKTPDIKLELPILVGDQIVTWIESKASFGDLDNHQRYLKDQYRCYVNRFGPGLVIYWFGFIEELQDNEENFIIMDHLPENITHMKQVLNTE